MLNHCLLNMSTIFEKKPTQKTPIESIKPQNNNPKKICLALIVQNNELTITSKLNNIINCVQGIDYWVICDADSSDNTISVINKFFSDRNISGKIINGMKDNINHNKSILLQSAINQSDLLLLFNINDEIDGNIKVPDVINHDIYYLWFGKHDPITYLKPLIINNRRPWSFCGVFNEELQLINGIPRETILQGDYYIKSDISINKEEIINSQYFFMNNIKLLEMAYEGEVINKSDKQYDLAFKCANIYYNLDKYTEAMKWYEVALSPYNTKSQEKYIACYHTFKCYKALDLSNEGIHFLLKSVVFDKSRCECFYELILHYASQSIFDITYLFYIYIQHLYANIHNIDKNKLLFDKEIHFFHLPYIMIIVSEKLKKYEIGIKMYEIITTEKCRIFDKWHINNLIYNLQFFVNSIGTNKEFFKKFEDYMLFLYTNNYDMEDKLEMYKDLIDIRFIVKTGNKIVVNNNNKILFYIEDTKDKWNYSYYKKNVMNTFETSIIQLIEKIPKNYQVYIVGNVLEEDYENIHFINNVNSVDFITQNYFQTILINNISFFETYIHFKCNKLYILSSNMHLQLNKSHNSQNTCNDLLKKYQYKYDGCICTSNWHKSIISMQYGTLQDKTHVLYNGIDLSLFPKNVYKIKNRFVYSCYNKKLLGKMLNLWQTIVSKIPDAELKICLHNDFTNTIEDRQMEKLVKTYNNIELFKNLNRTSMYELFYSCEYWFYPTDLQKVSYITALEMLKCEVICIYYPRAALNEIIGNYGIPVNKGKEIDDILEISEEAKMQIRSRGEKYASTYSWDEKAESWFDIIL